MAKDVTKKITAQMVLDSTGFNASITGVNRQLQQAKAELQGASTQVGIFGRDSENLGKVQQALSKQVELHAKKVDVYRKSIEDTSSKMNDNIKERDKLKVSLDQANKKYDEAVKLYGKESDEAKKAKEEVNKLTKEYDQKEKAIEQNAKNIQYYETQMTKANTQLTKAQAELGKVNDELAKSQNRWLRASETLQESSEKLKDVGGKVESVGDSILKISAPMVGAGMASLKFANDFETSMAKVDTIADNSRKPIGKLRSEIVKLSDDTGLAATEVAEATYQAISASVDTAEATKVVGIAAKASKAGFTDVTTAIDGLTTVINAYGKEVDEADRLANQFLITQNEGKTSFGELSSSIGKVAPLAASANIEVEELLSSVATMTAQGLETSESMTALRGSISNIIKPSKQAAEMAELLGVDFNVAALETKGWMGFLQDLRKSMEEADPVLKTISDSMDVNEQKMDKLAKAGKKNSSEYKKLAKEQRELQGSMLSLAEAQDSPLAGFAQLFGSVQGLNGVLMLTSEAGMKKYNEAMEEMATNTTLLDESYDKMMNTTGERFKKSMNELKNQSIRFGDAIAPMMDRLSQGVGILTDKLGQLDDEQIKNIVSMGKLVLGAGAVLKIGGKTAQGIGGVVGGLSKMTGWLGKTTLATEGTGMALGGLTTSTGVAGKGVGAFGLAAKGATALINPWTLGIGAATLAGVGLYKHLNKEAIPEVKLFGEETSEATKKAVGAYMDLEDKAVKSLMDLKFNGQRVTKETAKEISSTFEEMGNQINQGLDTHFEESYKTMNEFFKNSSALSATEERKALEKLQNRHKKEKEFTEFQVETINSILERAAREKRELTNQEMKDIQAIQEKMRENAIKALSETELESKLILERMKEQAGRLTAQQAAEVVKNSAKQRDEAIKAAEDQYDKTVKEIIKMRDETGVISKDQADKLIAEARRQRDKSVDHARDMHKKVVSEAQSQARQHINAVDWETGEILKKWRAMVRNIQSLSREGRIAMSSLSSMTGASGGFSSGGGGGGGKGGGGGGFAIGTKYAPGGWSWVGEEGPELRYIPKGSKIYSHDQSMRMMSPTEIKQEINVYSPTALSPSEVARQNLKVSRQLAMEWGR